ncbi:MAG: mechanosensitive ion channel [Bacteroidetes bacterium]|nr:mechanosensitive ion channel [Bacteroidota bacterium]
MDFKEFLELYVQIGKFKLTVADILAAILILAVAKVSIWFLNQVMLGRYFRRKQVDLGRQAALRQFLGYIIWVLAVFAILETFGISSMIWASSAALLVGIGLGLQDTFKDLISGIVILVEGTVEVGDIVELDGTVARVNEIGLRTSKMETRDRVSILVPNSKLVVDKVTNWSHNESPTRFNIMVGVAYGSDLKLVGNLLIQAAKKHPKVLKDPVPLVQFKNFGDSSLEFELLFFTEEFFRIENVKSDIRLTIDRLFRENKVQVPFPQRDLWLRNPEVLR